MEEEQLWFKNAIIYQVHAKSFFDKNGDGIGDFQGLTEKLDYIESLGVTAIWLLPFFPSPLRDDGYDIADFYGVHSDYGTLFDFQIFLRKAHERGMRIIIELVLNHTSDQHPWFQNARAAPSGSSLRNFYIWSNTPGRYQEARIIFKDFESSNWAWDPIAKAYYFHRFYSHQPDLNYENPLVQKEILRIVDFWLEMGVDGLRLDAVPYLFKKEKTNCENLIETHNFIKKLRAHIDHTFTNRILIAEANQWPEDAAAYFGQEDECQMAFHFPLMPRMFMAIHLEDRFPITDILEQTPKLPPSCQWMIFLRNHDELTLEMVSDEERDYMYKTYAKDPKARINWGIRRRLAPLLDNDKAKIELMNVLLFSLPGTPVLYYGDEIGMGDNYYLGDRDGIRTPMQWTPDRNAGFSKANPQQLHLPLIIDPANHYELVNVENLEQSSSSLLWRLRRLISARKNHKAFGLGTLEFISSSNPKILCFTRTFEDETILIIVNLSRFSQASELDLEKYVDQHPCELFNQNPFPTIGNRGYQITLSPYGYYWLLLKSSTQETKPRIEQEIPKIHLEGKWKNVFEGKNKAHFENKILPKYIQKARWFERKTERIRTVRIKEMISFAKSIMCIINVFYHDKEDYETYLLPISFNMPAELTNPINTTIAHVQINSHEGILYDSIEDPIFQKALLNCILQNRQIKGPLFDLIPHSRSGLKKEWRQQLPIDLPIRIIAAEQSNSSLQFGQQYFLKIYRRLEEGIHPEVEILRFLTEKAHFSHIPKYAGSIQYKQSQKQPLLIGLLEDFVSNEGTAWSFTLDSLSQFYEAALTHKERNDTLTIDGLVTSHYLEGVRLLGQRTAELHLALSSSSEDPDFCPEPYSKLYQRSLYQDLRNNVKTTMHQIKDMMLQIPEGQRLLALEVTTLDDTLLNFFKKMTQKPLSLMKIRLHSDLHLEQVLYTGKDFLIMDFEGEPLYSFDVRKRKRSVLKDVTSMVRSFHYAAHKALLLFGPEVQAKLAPYTEAWCQYVITKFLNSYLENLKQRDNNLLPKTGADAAYLFQVFVLKKALYEISYELNMRPDWISLPCKGLLFHVKNNFEECFINELS